MATKARIDNGIVCEILTAEPFPPFHASLVWAECGPEVQPGWTWDGTTFAAPVLAPLADRQAQAWEAIKAFRDAYRQRCGYQAGGKWWQSDDYSKSQQMGLVIMGAALPAVQWKTLDGSFIAMTPTLAQEVFGAACASDQAVFAAAEVHHAAMLAAPDPAAYDFSGGWPPAFPGVS